MSDFREDAKIIASTAMKLLNETARLRRDIAVLLGCIAPFESERPPPPYADHEFKIRDLKGAIEVIKDARKTILGCELTINAIRAAMDGIAKSAISREEMKPWLEE